MMCAVYPHSSTLPLQLFMFELQLLTNIFYKIMQNGAVSWVNCSQGKFNNGKIQKNP
jgi:hypothetical protein